MTPYSKNMPKKDVDLELLDIFCNFEGERDDAAWAAFEKIFTEDNENEEWDQ